MRKWSKIASDYNSPFWRNYIWTLGLTSQPKIFGIPQVLVGIRSNTKKIDYLVIADTWKDGYEKLSKMVDEDINVLNKILDDSVKHGKEMNSFTEKFVTDDLSKYSNKKIVKAYQKHGELNGLEYAYGVMIPYLDFQEYHYVEDKLTSILQSKLNKDEVSKAFSIFTQPIEDSFAIEQEKSILKIYQKLKNKTILKKETSQVLLLLKQKEPGVYKKVEQHTKKYAWVFYVYSGPAATDFDFIETLKFYYQKGIKAEEKLSQLNKERNNLLKERDGYFSKMNLSEKEKSYVEIASKVVYLKPRRKDYQSKSYYHIEFLQKEIGKRLGWSVGQVRSATVEEIDAALNGKEVNIDLINERQKFHIVVPEGDGAKLYQGKEAAKWQQENLEEEKIEIKDLKEIEGQSAYPGKAKVIVRRVDMPDDMPKMQEGDILVSTATTPSIVPAIRKAVAIVADEGGLTCHAAIISREFNIPCVVGTKIGT